MLDIMQSDEGYCVYYVNFCMGVSSVTLDLHFILVINTSRNRNSLCILIFQTLSAARGGLLCPLHCNECFGFSLLVFS